MDRSNLSDLEVSVKALLDRLNGCMRGEGTGYAHGSRGGEYNERGDYGATGVGGAHGSPTTDGFPAAQVQEIIYALNQSGSDCERIISHQKAVLGQYRGYAAELRGRGAGEMHKGERSILEDIASAEELLARIKREVSKARKATSASGSGSIEGLSAHVAAAEYWHPSAMKNVYATPSVLDETLYLLKAQPVPGQSDLEWSVATPYLTDDSKARNGSITDKVKLGGGQITPPLVESYGPPLRFEGPEPPPMGGLLPHVSGPYDGDPNDPTQKANYDRQRGLLNY